MSHRYRVAPSNGYSPIVNPSVAPLKWLDFGLLRLDGGQRWERALAGVEACLVILGGRCHVRHGGGEWRDLGARDNVFGGRATAAYLPPGTRVEVEAAAPAEVAVCTAPAEAGGDPLLIRPEQVATRTVGAGNWTREVQDILVNNVPTTARRLLVGETYNAPGNWSSYPPHKHDVANPPAEVELEEVYHFRVNPAQGFGLQRLYRPEDGLDEVYTVESGDTVVIPRGYHPVAAAPGYTVYYLWMLAGPQRVMKPNDDPAHAWVKSLPAAGRPGVNR